MQTLLNASGALLSLAIASVSFLLSQAHPSFDGLVISMIFGMLISNMLVRRDILQKGIDIMLATALPLGIALYGTQLTFGDNVSYKTLMSVVAVFILSFAMTFFIARIFRLSEKLSTLLASGLSICGASAIAVVSPIIRADKEDTSISLITIMITGLVSVISYPIIWEFAGLDIKEFAFITGTNIPMLGQVKITAQALGPDALNLAVKFKLIRIFMLVFLVLGLSMLSHRWGSKEKTGDEITQAGRQRLWPRIPWFTGAFILCVILVNTVDAVKNISHIFKPFSSFFLSSALAAIGLSVDFDSITSEGARPLIAVFLSWALMALFIYAGLSLLHV